MTLQEERELEKRQWHEHVMALQKEEKQIQLRREAAENRRKTEEELGPGNTPPGYYNLW